MAKLSGGGITSNKNVAVGVKSGSPSANKVNPGGADGIGQSVFQNPTPLQSGTMNQVPLGNAVAPATTCGPGGSRVVRPAGGQGEH